MEERKRRKGPARVVKIEIPATPPPPAAPAKEEIPRLIDLGVNVDESGRYKLRYKVDVPGIVSAGKSFVEKLAGSAAGSLFDGLLGRKDEDEK